MEYSKTFQELSQNDMFECNGGIVWVPIIALGVALVGGGGYIGVRKYVGEEGKAAGQDAFRKDYLDGKIK
jgi:hypothetical protein